MLSPPTSFSVLKKRRAYCYIQPPNFKYLQNSIEQGCRGSVPDNFVQNFSLLYIIALRYHNHQPSLHYRSTAVITAVFIKAKTILVRVRFVIIGLSTIYVNVVRVLRKGGLDNNQFATLISFFYIFSLLCIVPSRDTYKICF